MHILNSGNWCWGIADCQRVLWTCKRGIKCLLPNTFFWEFLWTKLWSIVFHSDFEAEPKAYGCCGRWTCSEEKFNQTRILTPSWVAWFPQAEAT